MPDRWPSELDKDWHAWGQGAGGVQVPIEHLTVPGELIVDPFAGAAQWGRVANQMGRRWLGADIAAGGTEFDPGQGGVRCPGAAPRQPEKSNSGLPSGGAHAGLNAEKPPRYGREGFPQLKQRILGPSRGQAPTQLNGQNLPRRS